MASAYTVEQLLALKPVKASFAGLDHRVLNYLALWRKYHRMLTSDPRRMAPDSTVVMRYQMGTPNKVFRRTWIHIHGTTAGLSDLPRYPVRVFSVRVKFLEEHFKRCKRLLELLYRQFERLRYQGLLGGRFGPPEQTAPAPKPVKVIEITAPLVRRPAVSLSVSDAAEKRERLRKKAIRNSSRIAMYTHGNEYEQYSRALGGMEKTDYLRPFVDPPPMRGEHWKKYWYFYRKRGVWRPSEHHPYGDEEPVISNWLNLQ